ncbi:MAG: hypothetical protein CW691_08545 [Candidatus Bathyarchaeum sp.]|nr:MAG: hypothetical protein CW691_08545 [Candidatus Bathyarchaeum sp.]
MRLSAGRVVFVSCLLVLLLLAVPLVAADVTEFQVDSTDLQVYRDGLVRVAQALTVNETQAVVSFPLLSLSVDNFIVLDENQTVLDYEIEGNNLTVLTLGATSVSVQYDTYSLTHKDAELWTLLFDTPYNLTALLPEDSTIVYLSEMPASIDTDTNTMALSLFANQWEISYTFPLTPPAQFQISNLKVQPAEAKAGTEVAVSVTVTNIGGQTGSYTLSLAVNQTVETTRTVTLDKDASTTATFSLTKQTLGTYNVEIGGLVTQFTVSEQSSSDTPSNPSSNAVPIEYLVAAAAAVAVIVVVFLFFRKKSANTEKIFKTNPQLNAEEKDVINFLAENDGKAFESQIRERFPDIPRTSLWRLVKRLEKLEIINVKKIGLENQVELKK